MSPGMARRAEVLVMIAENMKRDAAEFDGKPFTGRNVAECLGGHGAAIAALAAVVAEMEAHLYDLIDRAVAAHLETAPHRYGDGSSA